MGGWREGGGEVLSSRNLTPAWTARLPVCRTTGSPVPLSVYVCARRRKESVEGGKEGERTKASPAGMDVVLGESAKHRCSCGT